MYDQEGHQNSFIFIGLYHLEGKVLKKKVNLQRRIFAITITKSGTSPRHRTRSNALNNSRLPS